MQERNHLRMFSNTGGGDLHIICVTILAAILDLMLKLVKGKSLLSLNQRCQSRIIK